MVVCRGMETTVVARREGSANSRYVPRCFLSFFARCF